MDQKQEDLLLNKLIASAGWLTRAYNKYQSGDGLKMLLAMREANSAIDEASAMLKEYHGRPKS